MKYIKKKPTKEMYLQVSTLWCFN